MKIIYKLGIALLKINELELLNMNFEEMMEHFKIIYNSVDKEVLIYTMSTIKITNKIISNLEIEFKDNPDKEIISNFIDIDQK